MNYSGKLRDQLHFLAHKHAENTGLPSYNSNGSPGVVLFEPTAGGANHGNFEPASWTAINANPVWRQRLTKPHSQKRRLPIAKRPMALELDSSNSSDALLMNCFCYPGAAPLIFAALGFAASGRTLDFGFDVKVPKKDHKFDQTEIDLWTGDLIIEAKLTEASFTSRVKGTVEKYRDLATVFDVASLPQNQTEYHGYQLIRNVLAAYSLKVPFVVLLDERRPDLVAEWKSVIDCIKDTNVKARCSYRTWQQVAAASPQTLQCFLESKYFAALYVDS